MRKEDPVCKNCGSTDLLPQRRICRACKREYDQHRYHLHKKEFLKRSKEWQSKNRERHLEYQRRYRSQNRERERRRHREYRGKNRRKINDAAFLYYWANRDLISARRKEKREGELCETKHSKNSTFIDEMLPQQMIAEVDRIEIDVSDVVDLASESQRRIIEVLLSNDMKIARASVELGISVEEILSEFNNLKEIALEVYG